MAEKYTIEDFFLTVGAEQLPFVQQLHDLLLAAGCGLEIKSAKSGYVISYRYPAKGGRVLANYVTRKKGVLARVYAEGVAGYQDMLATLPESMQRDIEKAPVCRRLLDPAKCSSKCSMGNIFTLNGTEHKKCRYNNFMFLVTEESTPHVRGLLEKELALRA